MDKLDEKNTEKIVEKPKTKGLASIIKKGFPSVKGEKGEIDKVALLCDILLFSLGFVLSRCRLFFGARPVGMAFVAMLPFGVWPTLVGAVLGGLTLGLDGIIFAAATLVLVLLRAAVSSSERDERGKMLLFSENLLTRMAISVLAGFITAVYEVMLSGLNERSLLFGLAMIILTPILTFALSGIFSTGIALGEIMKGRQDLLSLSGAERNERYDKIFFQLSALLLIFLISLSFRGVNIMGISVSYIFSGVATLIVARRFGALRGGAVGFLSSLSVSAPLSVSFALMGLCSGALMSLGPIYAIILGGVALGAWSIYNSGLTGLLSTLPEYLIAVAIALPIINKISTQDDADPSSNEEKSTESAEDMVGTMALAYQNRYEGSTELLPTVLSNLGAVVSRHFRTPIRLTKEEYREIVISVAEGHCIGCQSGGICSKDDVRPPIKYADRIAELLCEGKKIIPSDISGEDCQRARAIAEEINAVTEREEEERRVLSESSQGGEEYRLISSLAAELYSEDKRELRVDNSMTAPLTNAVEACGLTNGVIRAFGHRQKHFILAGEDENGTTITSFELRKSIERAADVRLSTPEYYKRGKMLLMECGIKPKLHASYATASLAGRKNQISGDTAICFESRGGRFYSLISDGMGSGELAQETSSFVGEFIRSAAELGSTRDGIIHILNHSLRTRSEECSATVDLFELDLLNGDGLFLKSGAAPSFVKRESSIFRIRSQTAPIGLLRSIDTERIRLQIKKGDHIIMLSDGVADVGEDAPWLLLLLGEPPLENLNDYATLILNEAVKNTKVSDDMTVTVIRVEED